MPEAILVVGGDCIEWVNPQAESLLGAAAGALANAPLTQILEPGELARLQNLEAHRRDGWHVPPVLRLRLRRADGTPLFADVAVAHSDGRRVLTARDAGESHAAEQLMSRLGQLSVTDGSIRDLESLFDAASPVFEALGWVACLTEARGDVACVTRMGGVRVGNPLADYVAGLVGNEVPLGKYPVVAKVVRTGQPLFLDDIPQVQPGPEHAATALSEQMIRSRGLSRSAWLPVPNVHGGTLVLSVAGDALSHPDFVATQLFAAQLASAHRLSQLRAELVRKERLAAVGEMSAVLAHEVRNPLGAIFNVIGGLRHEATSTAASGLLDVLSEEAERLHRLVSDLLMFARPPAAKPVVVATAAAIHEAIGAARQDPGAAGDYRLTESVPAEIPALRADPELLRRALVNLVVNAIQNVSAGGEVRVSAEPGRERNVVIAVGNEGRPIAPAIAERMFEPFFTTRAMGTGLGLALVKRAVEDMGGTVALRSSNAGPRFELSLPVADAS
ncbi:MAG: hypothetical protein JST54_15475 [Deltaproteobacteria bacterium]|nr:hypothetical protein [Deltaproteobacteria bacterium]